MLRPIDNYFLQQAEPVKSCLQFLREHILNMTVISLKPGHTSCRFIVTMDKWFVTCGFIKNYCGHTFAL